MMAEAHIKSDTSHVEVSNNENQFKPPADEAHQIRNRNLIPGSSTSHEPETTDEQDAPPTEVLGKNKV